MLFFSRSGTSFLFGSPAPVDILARQSDALPVRKGLVCDSQGSCAAFEYLDGGLRVYAREAFEPHALSNSPYDGGGMPGKDRSLWRFVAASEGMRLNPAATDAVRAAFETLDRVRQDPKQLLAIWSVVYEQATRKMFFRTADSGAIRELHLGDFDFGCRTPVTRADAVSLGAGRVGPEHFTPATLRAGLTLLRKNDYVPAPLVYFDCCNPGLRIAALQTERNSG